MALRDVFSTMLSRPEPRSSGQQEESQDASGLFARPQGNRLLPPNTRAPHVLGAQPHTFARGREVAALLLWTLAVFVALALASYVGEPIPSGQVDPQTIAGENWVGPVGALLARWAVSLVGVMSWVVP